MKRILSLAICSVLLGVLCLAAGCGGDTAGSGDGEAHTFSSASGVVEEAGQEAGIEEGQGTDEQQKTGLGGLFESVIKDDLMDSEEYRDVLPEEETLFRNNSIYYYYYELLDDEEKSIYDAIYTIAKVPTSTEYRMGVSTSTDPDTDEYMRSVSRAFQAMIFDHPELFWFRTESGIVSFYYPEEPSVDGTYRVMFQLSKTYDDYQAETTEINRAVDEFMADIDMTLSQPEIILQIHDKLIDTVTYDDGLVEAYYVDEDGFDYGYTMYGALVENSRGEACTAVCDGYSYTLTYLLQQAGMRALRIGGTAGGGSDDDMPHSWNLVNVEGAWYEIDATWDDQEPEVDPGDYLLEEAVSTPWYWDQIRHHLFMLTTDEMSHFVPDDSYVFYSADGYATFLAESWHVRDTAAEREVPESEDYLSYLAPAAHGEKYGYDRVNMWRSEDAWQEATEDVYDGATEDVYDGAAEDVYDGAAEDVYYDDEEDMTGAG